MADCDMPLGGPGVPATLGKLHRCGAPGTVRIHGLQVPTATAAGALGHPRAPPPTSVQPRAPDLTGRGKQLRGTSEFLDESSCRNSEGN